MSTYTIPATPELAEPLPSDVVSIVFETGSQVTELPENFAAASAGLLTSIDFTNATSLRTIGNNAFKDCVNLTGTLNIPSNVTDIGEDAFSGCTGFTGGTLTLGTSPSTFTLRTSISAFSSPSGVSIGPGAFYDCAFNTLYLNGDVTIGDTNTFGFFPPDGGTVQNGSIQNDSLRLFYNGIEYTATNPPPIPIPGFGYSLN